MNIISEKREPILKTPHYIVMIIFFFLCWTCWKVIQSKNGSEKEKFVSELTAREQKLRQKKELKLQNSYDHLLDFAGEHAHLNELKLAADRYFDAKSIYPYEIEPRHNLIKTYYELALEHSGYCYHAQKEINYALKYITRTENPVVYDDIMEKSTHLKTFCPSEENYAYYHEEDEDMIKLK